MKKVLILGSGALKIGEAGEFDYSGSQAIKALKEEGIKTILINPNIATIQTSEFLADEVYFLPINPYFVEQVIKKEKPSGILLSFGGQTALNCGVALYKSGVLKKYQLEVLGTPVRSIILTEDRALFANHLTKIGQPIAPSFAVETISQAKKKAKIVGYPVMVRAAYALGGQKSGVAYNEKKLEAIVGTALKFTPQVLIEKYLKHYKEVEYEIVRDQDDNCIAVCNMENFDPMGIHTGDSITVAPAMTLSDTCFQEMRNQAFRMMRAMGDFAGGCNVQFSVDPETEKIIAIEINPRVSRSSALASKATGYPIAKIAALLSLGYNLDELTNPVTKITSAFFEPTIDYVIVKIPRWNFDKFKGADNTLGLQMKSVGEVMSIGRSFQEALQKACQSLEIGRDGLGADGKQIRNLDRIIHGLENPTWDRIFHIKDALAMGVPVTSVQKITRIDRWFLLQIQDLVKVETEIKRFNLNNLPLDLMREAKQKGYSDNQIAHLLGSDTKEEDVYNRRKELGVRRVYKMVDTCAAEFPSDTNYFYSTFDGENETVVTDKKKIIVLGSGPNRIGQGIEFDYSCVHGLLAAKESGYEAIMVNCNPETVSTDFDMADKLYFEPVYWEHLYELIEMEKPEGVIVQLGGQTALKLAEKLHEKGIKIIGTSYENMDIAEDRGRFSDLLKELDIPYPLYGVAETADEAIEIAHKVGYPVLVRPSYVLGGQGMKIVINDEDLEHAVVSLLGDMPGNRVLIDHFLDRAEESESDSICDGEDVHVIGMMEHIEPAGIHSGDSSAVLPPFSLSDNVQGLMREYTKKLALALDIRGLLNIQFAIKDEKVYVIEANPRASRTVPFICKAYGVPYVNIAAKVMLGVNKLKDFTIEEKLEGYAIKQPVFSFNKFPKVNKELGPEMKSTGEAILFIKDLQDPEFRHLYKEKSMYLSK